MRGLVPLVVFVLDLGTGEGDLDHTAFLDTRKELVRAVKRAALNVAARVRQLHFDDGATPFGVAPLVAAHVHDPCNKLALVPQHVWGDLRERRSAQSTRYESRCSPRACGHVRDVRGAVNHLSDGHRPLGGRKEGALDGRSESLE